MGQNYEFQKLPELYGVDLRIIRTELGLTQKQMGEILGRSYYWVWECEDKYYNGLKPLKLIHVKILKDKIAPDLWVSILDKIEEVREEESIEYLQNRVNTCYRVRG